MQAIERELDLCAAREAAGYRAVTHRRGDMPVGAHIEEGDVEEGDARAATNLAVLLSRGDGVAKDPAAAVRWYGVAAQSKTKSKLRDMHDLRSVPRPPPPTPPPPPAPVRTFSEEAPDVSTSTNASSADAAAPPDAPQSTPPPPPPPESPGDAPVEEDAVVDVVEEDTALGDDPVPAVAEEPDVSAG